MTFRSGRSISILLAFAAVIVSSTMSVVNAFAPSSSMKSGMTPQYRRPFISSKNNVLVTSMTCSSSSSKGAKNNSSNNDNVSGPVNSRRNILKNIVLSTATITWTATQISLPARADVTNKVASSAALRIIKRSIQELKDMEPYVTANDYENVKLAIRVPPFTEVRKNCQILIRGGEDGPEADNLHSTYAEFIKKLEELDSKASLGMRGRKGMVLQQSYDDTLRGLIAFEEVAERAAEIPLQYSDEGK